jgi:hypothetical protein
MVLSIMIPSRNTGVTLSVEALERLAVMRSLETNAQYSIPDYLSTGWQSRLWRATVLGGGGSAISMDFSASVVDVVPPTRILSSSSRQGAADDGDDVSLLSSSSFNDQIIHEGWRDQVCQWTYAVADYFGEILFPFLHIGILCEILRQLTTHAHSFICPHDTFPDFDREVAGIALSYLDRHFSRRVCTDKNSYQLAAMTSLFLSIKLHTTGHTQRKRLVMSDLVNLGRGVFSPQDIVNAEVEILSSLSWYVHPPTPHAFMRELLVLLSEIINDDNNTIDDYYEEAADNASSPPRRSERRDHIAHTATYLIELTSCDYALSTKQRPSSIAIASIAYAIEINENESLSSRDNNRANVLIFLRAVARAGFAVSEEDGDVAICFARLHEIYRPTPPPDRDTDDGEEEEGDDNKAEEDNGTRVAVVASPTCASSVWD